MVKYGVLLLNILILSVFSFSSFVHAQDIANAPGKIAYIGSDFNIYTIRPQPGSTPIALSSDAELTRTQARVYEWPMWSTDGKLAYAHSLLTNRGEVTTEILVSEDGETPGELVYSGEQEYFTYASWAPAACGEDCNELALLLNDPSGLLVRILHREGSETTNSVAGTGAPFYTHWSPDGTRMVWQRNNAQFEIFNVADGRISAMLAQTPGKMFTPVWSPVDDRLLLGIQGETGTDLVVVDGDEVTTLATEDENAIWFAWSPDGNSIAYINRTGPLVVLDALSGAEISRSPAQGVLAFFWSPDSQRIAYLTLGAGSPTGSFNASAPAGVKTMGMKHQNQQPSGVSWSILDVDGGTNHRYAPFLPTNQFIYLMQYFDQFAASHRIWSPDSRYLVYSEIAANMAPVIQLLDTTQESGVPFRLAEGLIGIWSFD